MKIGYTFSAKLYTGNHPMDIEYVLELGVLEPTKWLRRYTFAPLVKLAFEQRATPEDDALDDIYYGLSPLALPFRIFQLLGKNSFWVESTQRLLANNYWRWQPEGLLISESVMNPYTADVLHLLSKALDLPAPPRLAPLWSLLDPLSRTLAGLYMAGARLISDDDEEATVMMIPLADQYHPSRILDLYQQSLRVRGVGEQPNG